MTGGEEWTAELGQTSLHPLETEDKDQHGMGEFQLIVIPKTLELEGSI